jgi:Tfp pilus assembly protein PilE
VGKLYALFVLRELLLRGQHHSQKGQGMTEYVIVVALVAVAAIAVYQSFGQVVRSQTAAMARELAGEDGTRQVRAARSAADSAASQSSARTLKSFTGNAERAR